MRHHFVALTIMVLCLAGCADTVYKPETVEVPVAVPCKPPSVNRPNFPLKAIPISATIFEKTKAALVEINLRQSYELQLEAALKGCSQ